MTSILNSNQLQSDTGDFTEQAAILIGSGCLRFATRKYSHYSVQFRFALCDFENMVQLRFEKNSVKRVCIMLIRVWFDSLVKSLVYIYYFIIQGDPKVTPYSKSEMVYF